MCMTLVVCPFNVQNLTSCGPNPIPGFKIYTALYFNYTTYLSFQDKHRYFIECVLDKSLCDDQLFLSQVTKCP